MSKKTTKYAVTYIWENSGVFIKGVFVMRYFDTLSQAKNFAKKIKNSTSINITKV
jgi:hypothetical protein